MTKPRPTGRAIAAATLALGLACGLTGCGSQSDGEPATTAAETAEAITAESSPEPTTAQVSGPNYTIVDYIRDNGITETPVQPGDPGTPTVFLPVPQGWNDAADQAPEWAWSAMVYSDPAVANDPPSVIALMSRLTGNVDPAKLLEFAPGELMNLPGFDGGDGSPNTLSGFAAYQIGGTYERDGIRRLVAQKTVVIPVGDAWYVLQLNADGREDQAEVLMDATSLIDEQTQITS